MFDVLTEKLNKILNSLRNKGKLSEKDIDEALHQVRLALLEADVNFKVVKSFLVKIREQALTAVVLDSLTPGQQMIKIVNEELINILGKEPSYLKENIKPPSIIMLVGLQGAGKTTTVAKLAQNLKHSGQRPLMVAADTKRPAAIEQLIILGRQLDIPVYYEDMSIAPLTICHNAMKQAREMAATRVVIDTQGRLHIDRTMMGELVELRTELQPEEILLVVDAMTGQDAIRIAEEFNNTLGLTGLILSKMDGDSRGGAALSIRFITNIPIKFIGTGEKMGAIEPFYPDRLASRILGMGDMLSLIEKAEKTFDEERTKQLEKKMRTASLTLEDFLWQLNQIKKMGPLNQILEMIPGFTKLPANLADGSGDDYLRRIEAIIFSMTSEERKNPTLIDGSRRKRIARGSGTTPRDVNQLLNQFEQLRKISKAIVKGKLPSNLTNVFRR